jgi:hypothetical protein
MLNLILGSRRFQAVAILVVGGDAELKKALPEPVGQEGLLVIAQPDPAVLVDQIHDGPVGLGG